MVTFGIAAACKSIYLFKLLIVLKQKQILRWRHSCDCTYMFESAGFQNGFGYSFSDVSGMFNYFLFLINYLKH